MRRAVKYLFLVFFVFKASAQTEEGEFFVSEIRSAEQEVFKIMRGDGLFLGTGFPIEDSEKIYIVTNLHVILSSRQGILIENKHQGSLKTKSVLASTEVDLALIEVDDYKGPVFKLADFTADSGSGYLMGFPNSQFKITEVRGIHFVREVQMFHTATDCNDTHEEDVLGLTDINVPIREGIILKGKRNDIDPLLGNSGGPLLSRKTEALGVIFYGDCQELYFIASRQIKSLLQKCYHDNLKNIDTFQTQSCLHHSF